MCGLRWRHVDLERRQARIFTSKNDELRVLPLTKAVVDELTRIGLRQIARGGMPQIVRRRELHIRGVARADSQTHRSFRGFRPDEIITKTKHGFGLPFGPWLQMHQPLRQLALDSLTDLKERGIVRPEFIDELTSRHVEVHADYYGTMVWILMMLEQWFGQHGAAARPDVQAR